MVKHNECGEKSPGVRAAELNVRRSRQTHAGTTLMKDYCRSAAQAPTGTPPLTRLSAQTVFNHPVYGRFQRNIGRPEHHRNNAVFTKTRVSIHFKQIRLAIQKAEIHSGKCRKPETFMQTPGNILQLILP